MAGPGVRAGCCAFGKFQDRIGRQTPGDTARRDGGADFSDYMIPIKKNGIDFEAHSEGVDGFTRSDPEAVAVVKMGMEKEALAPLSAGSSEYHAVSNGGAGGGVGYGVVHGSLGFYSLIQSDWPRELSRYASEYIPIGVV